MRQMPSRIWPAACIHKADTRQLFPILCWQNSFPSSAAVNAKGCRALKLCISSASFFPRIGWAKTALHIDHLIDWQLEIAKFSPNFSLCGSSLYWRTKQKFLHLITDLHYSGSELNSSALGQEWLSIIAHYGNCLESNRLVGYIQPTHRATILEVHWMKGGQKANRPKKRNKASELWKIRACSLEVTPHFPLPFYASPHIQTWFVIITG